MNALSPIRKYDALIETIKAETAKIQAVNAQIDALLTLHRYRYPLNYPVRVDLLGGMAGPGRIVRQTVQHGQVLYLVKYRVWHGEPEQSEWMSEATIAAYDALIAKGAM